MHDLNHIYYFAKIVEHGGLSAASASLRVSKSVLSQHLSKLEEQLGVRLIQRTTRRLQITDVGARYYERCRAILREMDQAARVIDDVREIPRGRLRIAAALNFTQLLLTPVLVGFMAEYPEVDVSLDITNREVDLVAEGYDLALRIAPELPSSSLISRAFMLNQHLLVAAPSLIARWGEPKTPRDLEAMPTVTGDVPAARGGRHEWLLRGPDGTCWPVHHHPRLVVEDLTVIKQSAISGCGVADLPPQFCQDALNDGGLVRLLPSWSLPVMKLYAVYPSRDGLPYALRAFIDYLADQLRPRLDEVLKAADA